MTNRRSYLYNLYVDNATASPKFAEQAIAEIEKYKPAAILVDDFPMNQIPASRFTVWAAPVYKYIKDHYDYAGTEVGNEIYLRRKNSTYLRTNSPFNIALACKFQSQSGREISMLCSRSGGGILGLALPHL